MKVKVYHRSQEGDRFERIKPVLNPCNYDGSWAVFIEEEVSCSQRFGEYLMIADDGPAYLYRAKPERPVPPVWVVRV